MSTVNVSDQATLSGVWDRLAQGPLSGMEAADQDVFRIRYELYMPDVIRPLEKLYGDRPDFAEQLEKMLQVVAKGYAERPKELRLQDLRRTAESDWFQQSNMLGYVCYADRFAGSLDSIADKISYLQELGVTYLHLMPLLKPRSGPNDGGYAVENYREVNPKLGSMDDLRNLATKLRQHGVSLCIDLVCNHTAKEHEWAQKAVAGDPEYQDYYLMFADRTLPEQYEQTLPEVFPDFAPGNFTYYENFGRWVWTTFNEYQWDLNYKNPAVLREMLDIILFLANQGVSILRLDAVAFMWKRMGTDCQNQPEAHYILQAYRALSRIAAPGLIFKAEAIVSSDKLIPYLGVGEATGKECEIAYHNVFMVMLWSALAERRVKLMTYALQQMPSSPVDNAWNTYVRCHDDIGWAVRDEDAGDIGMNGFLHRAFLSDFYSGRFAHSFARGSTFQYNPRTGDRRISGALASLAGLELALENGDLDGVDLTVKRILLVHNMIFAFGGIPLVYMGDEIGLLNDKSFMENPDLVDDNRWMHRPYMDWNKAQERHDQEKVTGRIFQGIRQLIEARKRTPALHAQAPAYPIWTHNEHVFGLIRQSARGKLLILANFTEYTQSVSEGRIKELGFSGNLRNHLDNRIIHIHGWDDVQLKPYQALWLEKA